MVPLSATSRWNGPFRPVATTSQLPPACAVYDGIKTSINAATSAADAIVNSTSWTCFRMCVSAQNVLKDRQGQAYTTLTDGIHCNSIGAYFLGPVASQDEAAQLREHTS